MTNASTSGSHGPQNILASLFETRLLADVTIQVGDQEIKAHRAILSATSTWFADWFAEVVEAKGHESSLTVKLQDEDPAAMTALIAFCYLGTYDRYLQRETSSQSRKVHNARKHNVQLHMSVYAIADKYQAESLKLHACEAFTTTASEIRNTDLQSFLSIISEVLKVAHPVKSNILRNAAIELFTQYLDELRAGNMEQDLAAQVKGAPKEVTEILLLMVMKGEQLKRGNVNQRTCSACDTSFTYTGEPKSGMSQIMVCPFCQMSDS